MPGGVAADLVAGRRSRLSARSSPTSARLSRRWSRSTTTPPRCRTAPSAPASSARRSPAALRRAATSAAPPAAPSMPAARSPIRPMTGCAFDVPVLDDGDVNARVWIRIREVEQSLALHRPARRRSARRARSGSRSRRAAARAWRSSRASAATSSPRSVSATDGRIERCHLRDPSWFQWPLLEAVIEGNIVADFPLCNKSFNCSYSGHDL